MKKVIIILEIKLFDWRDISIKYIRYICLYMFIRHRYTIHICQLNVHASS